MRARVDLGLSLLAVVAVPAFGDSAGSAPKPEHLPVRPPGLRGDAVGRYAAPPK